MENNKKISKVSLYAGYTLTICIVVIAIAATAKSVLWMFGL